MEGRALLAWNLKRLRVQRGVSQERLAADTGVDRAYVSELERGLGNATVDLMDRLAAVLNVNVGEFLREPAGGEEPAKSLPKGRRPRV